MRPCKYHPDQDTGLFHHPGSFLHAPSPWGFMLELGLKILVFLL